MADLQPIQGAQQPAACTATAFQKVCATANVTVTPHVECLTPTVTCIGNAVIVTGAEPPCPGGVLSPNGSCSFTLAQSLCVEVPVEFSATSLCTPGSVFCFQPSTEGCLPTPPGCPIFEPRSAGFFQTRFNLVNFTNEQLCLAIQCVESASPFFATALTTGGCPGVTDPCPNITFDTCLSYINQFLNPTTVGPVFAVFCPGTTNEASQAVRQFLSVLLDVCFCTTTIGGVPVGGVSPTFEVDLSSFPAEVQALFPPPPVTVQNVIDVTNAALAACDIATLGLLNQVLSAMAQDAGITIILPPGP